MPAPSQSSTTSAASRAGIGPGAAGSDLRRVQRWGTLVLLSCVLLLGGLLGRVAWLQWHVTPADTRALTAQHTFRTLVMARRGSIYTADSTLIASSVRIYNFFVDPGLIFDPQGRLNALSGAALVAGRKLMARVVGRLLGVAPSTLLNTWRQKLYYANGSLRRFLWLKRDVDHAFYRRFEKARERLMAKCRQAMRAHHWNLANEYFHALDGVGFQESTRRVYPLGDFAGQVLGFVNSQGGLEGLEQQLNALLAGRPGHVRYTKDAADQVLWANRHGNRAPQNGMNIWLTINSVIQGLAQHQLDKACRKFQAHSGVAVVMNPQSGDIVAMADYPPLNPNTYQATPAPFWRNRAVTDPYEPGSAFKPFNLAWALKEHVVTLQTIFNCHHGTYHDPTGRLIQDVGGWGDLSVEDILVHSSNIGMTEIGWRMGIRRLYAGVWAFGFGQMTGSILPGESPGIVRPLGQWTKGTLTSASFGYGVAVTPLQLARALCAIANGGWLPTPQIVKAVEVQPGRLETWAQIAGPPVWLKIIPRWVAAEVRLAMEQVMVRGTGQYAISPRYRLFGKTGTANLALANRYGYHAHEYNATFIAGGPVPAPRLVCVVAVHAPNPQLGHYGGTVAGPACSRILTGALRYLQIPPDQGPATDPWWGKEAQLKKLKGLSH